MRLITESWRMHRPDAMMRELPMSRPRTRERKASRKTKRRAMMTFVHEREGPGLLVSPLGAGIDSISYVIGLYPDDAGEYGNVEVQPRRRCVVASLFIQSFMPFRPYLISPAPSPPLTPGPSPSPHTLDPLSPLSPISPWPPDPPHSEVHTSSISDPAHDLPSAKEIYGSIGVLLTYLAFIAFLAWSFFPERWLESVGWTWYPAQ